MVVLELLVAAALNILLFTPKELFRMTPFTYVAMRSQYNVPRDSFRLPSNPPAYNLRDLRGTIAFLVTLLLHCNIIFLHVTPGRAFESN